MITLFWISAILVIYTYVGYGGLLFILAKTKLYLTRDAGKTSEINAPNLSCALVIAAYNEESIIREKIENTLSLKPPPGGLEIFIVADGSTDDTTGIIGLFPQIKLLYQPVRNGKVAAINRTMKYINSEIVVFTDANTFLNEDALLNIVSKYSDQTVGGVAGEKRIFVPQMAEASSAGEGFYWKYESKLKQWDSELFTTIGAAGELFSIRRKLYEEVSENTILDDFIISMKIVQKGYTIAYEPNAYATESSSISVREELKRKIRIAAGGIQSILMLPDLLNPLKHPLLSFQYISHRVLRWTITPFLLPLIFFSNLALLMQTESGIYSICIIVQIIFYTLAIAGAFLERRKIKAKIAFIPYYFCVMNYAVIAGIFRFSRNQQSSLWEKAIRQENQPIQVQ